MLHSWRDGRSWGARLSAAEGGREVWVNKFSKWVLIDAKYDAHFEKNGVPLSALEIHDEVWRDGARSVICVVGPDRRLMKPDPETGKSETRPDTYRWCSWETDTNRFTAFPARPTSTLVVWDDENFRQHTWYRDGKPHWAYDTPYFIKTPRRDWIEWTPNVITSQVTVEGDKAHVFLGSCTPNFRSFQRKDDDGTWRDCGEDVEIALDNRAHMRFVFRAINLFGVAGPEHHVEIAYQPTAVDYARCFDLDFGGSVNDSGDRAPAAGWCRYRKGVDLGACFVEVSRCIGTRSIVVIF